MNNGPAGAQAVARALRLLDLFTDQRPTLNASEAAAATGLNRTTVYRLLSALEDVGLLARDLNDELYRLGPGAIALGARAMRANPLERAAQPELQTLASQSGETATLELPAGRDMLIVSEIVSAHLLGSAPSLGTRWPMYATSTGKAYLAALPSQARAAWLDEAGRLKAWTARTLTDRSALARQLETARRTGYAVVREELERGFAACGAAVIDHRGLPVGAISLGGPSARLTTKRLRELGIAVARAAARVSAALGYIAEVG